MVLNVNFVYVLINNAYDVNVLYVQQFLPEELVLYRLGQHSML